MITLYSNIHENIVVNADHIYIFFAKNDILIFFK